jgi:hypothetical protein
MTNHVISARDVKAGDRLVAVGCEGLVNAWHGTSLGPTVRSVFDSQQGFVSVSFLGVEGLMSIDGRAKLNVHRDEGP